MHVSYSPDGMAGTVEFKTIRAPADDISEPTNQSRSASIST